MCEGRGTPLPPCVCVCRMIECVDQKNIRKRKRRMRRQDIGEPLLHQQTQQVHTQPGQPFELSAWNDLVQDAWHCKSNRLPMPKPLDNNEIWDEWLWRCDPSEECPMYSLMNRSHLVGLVVAR